MFFSVWISCSTLSLHCVKTVPVKDGWFLIVEEIGFRVKRLLLKPQAGLRLEFWSPEYTSYSTPSSILHCVLWWFMGPFQFWGPHSFKRKHCTHPSLKGETLQRLTFLLLYYLIVCIQFASHCPIDTDVNRLFRSLRHLIHIKSEAIRVTFFKL